MKLYAFIVLSIAFLLVVFIFRKRFLAQSLGLVVLVIGFTFIYWGVLVFYKNWILKNDYIPAKCVVVSSTPQVQTNQIDGTYCPSLDLAYFINGKLEMGVANLPCVQGYDNQMNELKIYSRGDEVSCWYNKATNTEIILTREVYPVRGLFQMVMGICLIVGALFLE